MSGGSPRSKGRQERRPRKPRTLAPLLGLARGGVRQPWGLPAAGSTNSVKGRSGKAWRGIQALKATDRFRLWLAFVLSPGELNRFERWALSNDSDYAALLRYYRVALGSEDQEKVLLRLRSVVGLGEEDGLGGTTSGRTGTAG